MGLSNWNLVTTLVNRITRTKKECPKSYIGQKLPDDIVDRGRARALFPEGGGLQYKGGVLIWYMPLGFWFFSFVTAASIGATFHKPSHFKRNW